MTEVVHLEFNNWFRGQHYPLIPFVEENLYKFSQDKWCKENKLCVTVGYVDMSLNFCITAPLDWVKDKIPQVLSNEEYTYETVQHCYNKETTKWENCIIVHKAKYSDFLRYEDEDGVLEGRWGMPFQDYCEENLGVTWWDAEPDDDDEDEDET